MYRRLVVLLACLASIPASTASAQTTANGPYYATPSWDQTMPASTRFVVLANMGSQAVLDRETGLVWWRSPDRLRADQPTANAKCLDSVVGGRRGWRLPTIVELLSLFDPGTTAGPFLPNGHPFTGFNADFGEFWSSTETQSNYFNVVGYGYYFPTIQEFKRLNVYGTSDEATFCVRGPG